MWIVIGTYLFVKVPVRGQNSDAAKIDKEIERRFEKKEFAQAIPLLERLLAMHEKQWGMDAVQTIETVGALAFFHDQINERAEAIRYRERHVVWLRKNHPNELETGRGMNNLGLDYAETGQYEKAGALYKDALGIYGNIKDTQADQVTTMRNLALMLCKSNRHAEAVPIWKAIVASLEQRRKAPDKQTTEARLSLARELGHSGDIKAAQEFAAQIQKESGSAAPDKEDLPPSVESLMAEANRLFSQGQFSQALPLLEKLLSEEERLFGGGDVRIVVPISNLALICMKLGDFSRAAKLYERALDISRGARGPKSPEVAQVMNNLALTYAESGAGRKAETLYRESLAIRESAGHEDEAVAETLNNLAALKMQTGDLATAEPLFERAIGIYKKVLGEQSSAVARALSSMCPARSTTAPKSPRAIESRHASLLRSRFRESRHAAAPLDCHL